MHVYLVGSQEKLVERIDDLRRLVNAVHKEGHILARDWIEPAYVNEVNKAGKGTDWPSVFKESIEAITRSDVVIAEVDTPSLGVGYQIAAAIHLKKPTLLLRSEELDDNFFIAGLRSDVAVYKKYNEHNIEDIVKDFLVENDIQAKDLRFNFFIDRQIYNYLRWASVKKKKTKAEILRELVTREIDKDKEDL